MSKLLAFFGVGSIDAWTARYGRANVAYRHSPGFESDEAALATWRRQRNPHLAGERAATYMMRLFRSKA